MSNHTMSNRSIPAVFSLALVACLGGCRTLGDGATPGVAAVGAGHGHAGQVVAESQFGHGSVSAPVRPAKFGQEVRLPGGTWIDCGRSCSETLRTESIDFWENKGAGANRIDHPAGIFGRLGRNF
jgi:hypothetical protein